MGRRAALNANAAWIIGVVSDCDLHGVSGAGVCTAFAKCVPEYVGLSFDLYAGCIWRARSLEFAIEQSVQFWPHC